MVLLFAVFAAANMYIRDYIPVVAASQGATLDQAAMLVTVVGAMDLVSRLSLGFLADTHLLTPSQILGAAHLALGEGLGGGGREGGEGGGYNKY